MSKLKILFLSAEAYPFVKIGGLGDVAGSLPPALLSLGNIEIRLCLPFHGAIQRQAYDLHRVASFQIPHASGPIQAEALETHINGLPVYLISGNPIPADAPVYSSNLLTDGHKFTFFSLAALELMHQLDWVPNIIHANDWHTAPAIYALKQHPDPFYLNAVTVLGLHNLPYLGVGAGPSLGDFGLPPVQDAALPPWARHAPLPLGLLAADHIIVASPNYAKEIMTPEFGSGLHDFLRRRKNHISGILNGLDTEVWNPKTDAYIAVNYDRQEPYQRVENKNALLKEFNLDGKSDSPLLAVISRLDHQKGIDLIPHTLAMLERHDWQLIILGTGIPAIEESMRKLEVVFPNRVRTAIRFDSNLSHRIYAGADILLIPSRYEPCGLTQMIAMRYGCVPVARATGGLSDTIKDPNSTKPGTGFLFADASPTSLAYGIRRALDTYQDSKTWSLIQKEGLKQDFSWDRFALQYKRLYEKLLKEKQGALKSGSNVQTNRK